jgi:hypothetical protein
MTSGIRFVLCGRTEKDKTKLIIAFRNFAKASKMVLITVLIPQYAMLSCTACLLILFISLYKCLTQLSYTYACVNIICQLQLIHPLNYQQFGCENAVRCLCWSCTY